MQTMLEQAVAFIKAGDTEKGKQLLAEVIRQNPRDENAWLWMTRCVATAEQKKYCFEKVLQINPQNQHAVIGLRRLNNPASPNPPTQPKVIQQKPVKKKRVSTAGTIAIIGLGSIVVFLCICSLLSRMVPGGSNTPATSLPPLKPLRDLALNKAEIEDALQVITPLQSAPSSLCDNSKIECFSSGYISDDGDIFVLLLHQYSNDDEAFDYVIARQVQLEQTHQATDMDIPTTSGNHRWLMVGFIAGEPVYYGGANAGEVFIHMIWSRSSYLISENEAVQTFSRLLDRQISKIGR